MRVLLTTGIGSRGDVQPLVALASRLRESGHQARFCVPPDFLDWVEGLGFPVTPIGPQLRGTGPAQRPSRSTQPSAQPARTQAGPGPRPAGPAPQGHATGTPPQRLGELTEALVAEQFATIAEAAQGCDVIVATALQVAARSVAETMDIRYGFAAFCPAFLPSPHHPPPPLAALSRGEPLSAADHQELWDRHAGRFNEVFGVALNRFRASVGLGAVEDVRPHVFTERPWLAADPVLAPWPGLAEAVWQMGPWVLPDERPLDPELEAFLAAGEPPVYFGFGSMRMPAGLAEVIMAAVRRGGRRAVIAAGWAGLTPPGPDGGCLGIGEVNQQALFGRVAAVVHHGGAGTTTAAALAGVPQVVIPQAYDQPYWAQRVTELGIGATCPPGTPDTSSLAEALDQVLQPSVAARAQALRPTLTTTGTQTAATNLAGTASRATTASPAPAASRRR
ncbi:MAG TPA: glycosyltransferase [Streptosporangiaceae bacterium]|jgi:vancomycin aglycone glucosyltransferase